ncbi:MAG: stage III sporulation protein AG [Lachnospiraceae bacterium]|nr:stage III sporulation protein AG [Lachnospiraceae bacterium]MDD3615164.1 stage III sporulation protein AG [Lachnospiraceae bacterium]
MKKWFGKFQDKKKKEYLLILLLTGMLLLVISLPTKGTKDNQDANLQDMKVSEAALEDIDINQQENKETQEYLEKKLEYMLSQVEGAGEVKVMITLETTEENVVEKDVEKSTSESVSGSANNSVEDSSEKTNNISETTVYETSADDDSTPYIVMKREPEIRGVLILAQGGDNPVIQENILTGVCALFQIEVHKIKVMKMK